jgi:hypothetical protein
LQSVGRRGLLAALGTVVLFAAPAARAGGDFVDLAVGGGRVWFVGPGVRSLDARTGRTMAMPQLVGAAYPLSVALAAGAAWVASVENGYVWGTLSRIDERTERVRVVWRRRRSSVQYVAAGAGSVWALIGSAKTMRIARFTLSGRLLRVWRVPGAGRMAADDQGCWISGDRWLLRIDPAGRLHRVLRAPLGDIATGAGAVWLPRARSVLRLDERTGRVRILATGRLDLGGFQHDIAVGDGALWALHNGSRTRAELMRYDLRTGRRTGSARLPGIADALVVRPGAVWVATISAGGTVLRLDPRTLRRTLVAHV